MAGDRPAPPVEGGYRPVEPPNLRRSGLQSSLLGTPLTCCPYRAGGCLCRALCVTADQRVWCGGTVTWLDRGNPPPPGRTVVRASLRMHRVSGVHFAIPGQIRVGLVPPMMTATPRRMCRWLLWSFTPWGRIGPLLRTRCESRSRWGSRLPSRPRTARRLGRGASRSCRGSPARWRHAPPFPR